jgi:hypothetical protein
MRVDFIRREMQGLTAIPQVWDGDHNGEIAFGDSDRVGTVMENANVVSALSQRLEDLPYGNLVVLNGVRVASIDGLEESDSARPFVSIAMTNGAQINTKLLVGLIFAN